MRILIDNSTIFVIVCSKFWKRLKGMMFSKKQDHGYYFPNCNGIHTFFMFQAIDVILTDKNDVILYYYKNVKPWRIILPKKDVKNTYEFPTHFLKNPEIGDKIKRI